MITLILTGTRTYGSKIKIMKEKLLNFPRKVLRGIFNLKIECSGSKMAGAANGRLECNDSNGQRFLFNRAR